MNSTSPLHLGDEVEIIGPPKYYTGPTKIGEKFKISWMRKTDDGMLYAADNHPWHPASSLRKVRVVDEDELQIGDEVEVACPGSENFGKKFQISHFIETDKGKIYTGEDIDYYYPASSLRKLSPDEISPAERGELAGKTIGEAAQEFSDEVEKAKDAIRDMLAPLVDDRLEIIDQKLVSFHDFQMDQNREVGKRLSAIEKRHDEIIDCLRRLANLGHDIVQIVELHEGRFDGIENRLALVEAFQGHLDKINEAREPLAEEICKDPDFLSKILDERLQEIQAFSWGSGLWTIDISRGNMHLRNSGRDGGKLGEWAKRVMQDE